MPSRSTLPALTSLRFFAALAIFVFHIWPGLQQISGDPGPAFTPAGSHLSTGVTFFFVLSGFILTHNYQDTLRRPALRSAWNFYVARWARIYPVHVLSSVLLLPLTYHAFIHGYFGKPLKLLAANATLTQAFTYDPIRPFFALNPVAWSLSVEGFFYLCFPLLIPALTTGSLARRSALLLLCLTPWAIALTWTLGVSPLGSAPERDLCFFPPVRLTDFVTGILLAVCWRQRPATAKGSAIRATALEVGAILFLLGWGWGCVRIGTSPAGSVAVRWGGLYLPPFALLVWVFARGEGLVFRLLATRPLVYLGEISYAFYMFHFPVLIYFLVKGPQFGLGEWSWGWKWATLFAVTLVMSAACYHLYELPLRDRLKRRLSLRQRPSDEAAVEAGTAGPTRPWLLSILARAGNRATGKNRGVFHEPRPQ